MARHEPPGDVDGDGDRDGSDLNTIQTLALATAQGTPITLATCDATVSVSES